MGGSIARSYRITVSAEYVEATRGGRKSVVYETYRADLGPRDETFPHWILWLAESSFPAPATPPSVTPPVGK